MHPDNVQHVEDGYSITWQKSGIFNISLEKNLHIAYQNRDLKFFL